MQIKNPQPLDQTARSIEFAAERAVTYIQELSGRAVAPSVHALEQLTRFDEPLPTEASDPIETVELLHELGSPATVATAAGRFMAWW